MLETVNLHLEGKGCGSPPGTIVDATIISTSSSTKNRTEARPGDAPDQEGQPVVLRDEEAHVGVDSRTKLIHTAVVTPANVADATVLLELLHGRNQGLGRIRRIVVKAR